MDKNFSFKIKIIFLILKVKQNNQNIMFLIKKIKKISLLIFFLTGLIFISNLKFTISQNQNLEPKSKVFPSARWAWYIITNGVAWPAGGMTQDDVTRWIAAHSDLLVAGTVTALHDQVNPNLVSTWYQEWFYSNLLVSSSDTKQVRHWSDGYPIDG